MPLELPGPDMKEDDVEYRPKVVSAGPEPRGTGTQVLKVCCGQVQ